MGLARRDPAGRHRHDPVRLHRDGPRPQHRAHRVELVADVRPGLDERLPRRLEGVTAAEACDGSDRVFAAARACCLHGRSSVRAGSWDVKPRPDAVVGLDPLLVVVLDVDGHPHLVRAARKPGDVDPLECEEPWVVVGPSDRETRSARDRRAHAAPRFPVVGRLGRIRHRQIPGLGIEEAESGLAAAPRGVGRIVQLPRLVRDHALHVPMVVAVCGIPRFRRRLDESAGPVPAKHTLLDVHRRVAGGIPPPSNLELARAVVDEDRREAEEAPPIEGLDVPVRQWQHPQVRSLVAPGGRERLRTGHQSCRDRRSASSG